MSRSAVEITLSDNERQQLEQRVAGTRRCGRWRSAPRSFFRPGEQLKKGCRSRRMCLC